MRDLMDVLLKEVVQDEGFARELAEAAHRLGPDGDLIPTQAMRSLSRRHQVRAIAGRAELAAFTERYVQSVNRVAEWD